MIKPQTLTTLKESRIILKLDLLSKLFGDKDKGFLVANHGKSAMLKYVFNNI
ncbi:protein of unknown function [Candidatus Methylopumilus planktonicus]|uniref:Uncharacterized protein n=1 Tax=Candidatus Methylopumilus planktonicus TaxID=1581557 RepID=A0A0D6EUS9_9PROT|nr:protein of unknown function [Candidatus Methylopumilus planktonicus]